MLKAIIDRAISARRARSSTALLAAALAVVFGAGGGVALALPNALLCPCNTWNCGMYIGGGGAIVTDTGDANFSIFVLDVPPPSEAYEPAVTGGIHWTGANADGSDITLTSVQLTDCWEEEGSRWISGLMSVDGEGEVPFLLKVFDSGPPALGKDMVELVVGSALEDSQDGFGYRAAGNLSAGDVWLMKDVPLEAMEPGAEESNTDE